MSSHYPLSSPPPSRTSKLEGTGEKKEERKKKAFPSPPPTAPPFLRGNPLQASIPPTVPSRIGPDPTDEASYLGKSRSNQVQSSKARVVDEPPCSNSFRGRLEPQLGLLSAKVVDSIGPLDLRSAEPVDAIPDESPRTTVIRRRSAYLEIVLYTVPVSSESITHIVSLPFNDPV